MVPKEQTMGNDPNLGAMILQQLELLENRLISIEGKLDVQAEALQDFTEQVTDAIDRLESERRADYGLD